MKTLSLTEIEDLHRAGDLMAAKQAYLDYLQNHPKHSSALHALALLCAEQNELDQALIYLEQAIQQKPEDAVLLLHLANIHKAKKQFAQAIATLQTLIQKHPHYAAAYNNLGTIYFTQENWPAAEAAFQEAIILQADYVDAYYNLGLTLSKLHRYEAAEHTYQALIELAPTHPGARFQLGCLLMQLEKYQAATPHFLMVANTYPTHFETQTNLGACYLKLGQIEAAKTYYTQALTILPNDSAVLFNLGVIHMQTNHLQEALQFYLRAAVAAPDYFDVHNNLGVAYLMMQDKDNALKHFQEALRIQPGQQAVQHTVNILMRSKNLTISPPEYVRNLFDSYADHYDFHLTRSLRYQVPQLLYQTLQPICDLTEAHLAILDLGCGTGLCGELFKPAARSLTGVDISTNMLKFAKQKQCYDDLIVSDILVFLTTQQDKYDLILAGDVIEYFGDLSAIFTHIHQALRPQGLFIFNTEISPDKPYEMTDSGRFAHTPAYVKTLAHEQHFTLLQQSTGTLRTQNGENVMGHVYVLRKM